jgi:hypothetical protein
MAASIYQNTTPVTQAASPVTSPFQQVSAASQVIATWTATGGSTAVAAEWSFDGVNVNTEIGDTSLTTATAAKVQAPYVRFKITQTSADMSAFAMYCQAI